MNNPFNKIPAFARQASAATRGAIKDARGTARVIVKETGIPKRIGLGVLGGAVAGGVTGKGWSVASRDGRDGRDIGRGAVAGAVFGAGWGGRQLLNTPKAFGLMREGRLAEEAAAAEETARQAVVARWTANRNAARSGRAS